MSTVTASPARPILGRGLTYVAPALIAAAALLAVALAPPPNPASVAVLCVAGATAFVLALRRFPLLLLWAVPVSMAWFVYLPVMHYEALVLALGLVLLLGSYPQIARGPLRVPTITARYLLFLAAMAPAVLWAPSLWRFGGGIKFFLVGLVGFEVARRGAMRFGRGAMLLGPVAFLAITAAMLSAEVAGSGIAAFRAADLRAFLSTLSWGASNYIAAVTVLLMPALVYLIRSTAGWFRLVPLGVLAWSLAAMLFTTSRGGFVMSVAYLVLVGLRARRVVWLAVGVAALVLVGAMFTPLGHALIARFTDARGVASVFARVLIWQAAWQRGVAHLPFGVGVAQGLVTHDSLLATDPHNYLLTLFSEMGIPGLLLWLWLFAAAWTAGRRLRVSAATHEVGTALLATLAIAFFNMQFEPTLTGGLYHLLFWWLVGIYYADGPAEPIRATVASGPAR
jgi:hypothetical protein